MMSLRMRLPISAMVMLIALVACQTVPIENIKPISPALKEEAFALSFASLIVYNCNGLFKLNNDAVKDLNERAKSEARSVTGAKQGFNEAKAMLAMATSEKERQERLFAYIEKHGILVGQRHTWCGAGTTERSGRTSVGKYLLSVLS